MATKSENSNLKCLLIAATAFVAGAIITYIVTKDGTTTEPLTCPRVDYTNDAPFPHISAATAHDIAHRYEMECQPALTQIRPEGADGNPDARAIVFSLPVLKKYIWELENTVCKNGNLNVEDLGIRFYYAKYPDLNESKPADLESLPSEYSYRHTVFLSPAVKEKNIYRDFNPNNTATYKLSDTPDKDLDSNMFLMNHGNITPPPFPDARSSADSTSKASGLHF